MTIKALIIAEAANPEWVSVPLVGWSLANALRKVTHVHLVTQVRNREAILKFGLVEGRDFTAIDAEAIARPMSRLTTALIGRRGVGWTTGTAIFALSYYYFEWLLWRRFGAAIKRGEYDIVHRVTPLSPTTPSIIASKCQRVGVPFVVGPLNGGVPWPKGFDTARRKEREWLSYVRGAYRLLPGYKSTLKSAAALLIGSRDTLLQTPAAFHYKCVYIPENAIDPDKFSSGLVANSGRSLRACFIGRLVPYKGPDILLEALEPLLREGSIHLDILGDGPMMPALRDFIATKGLTASVTLHGWVDHRGLQDIMVKSQLLTFPSIREFGGGVVLEAMALGLVPVIVDYGGPAELVNSETGVKVPIGHRNDIIANFRQAVSELCREPQHIPVMSQKAKTRVQALFTWDVKAAQVVKVYDWVLRTQSGKPSFFQ